MRPRVLILEDEAMLALVLADIVRSAGLEVAGPVRSQEDALRLLTVETPSLALLDYCLADGPCDGICEVLRASGIPFVWLTGFDPAELPPGDEPVFEKPIDVEALKLSLRLSVAPARQLENVGGSGRAG
jgi:CheY-like chemotaxis protein